jgi:hypothetical protein
MQAKERGRQGRKGITRLTKIKVDLLFFFGICTFIFATLHDMMQMEDIT